jgi:lysozyme
MTMNRTLIEQTVEGHEGRRTVVYRDTRGNLTIGIGFNLDALGAEGICGMFNLDYDGLCSRNVAMTDAQVDEIFEYQLNLVIGQAMQILPNFATMPDSAQAAICDMIFEMGMGGFCKFTNTIRDLRTENYKQAAVDALDSEWAKQVPTRAADDAKLLEEA